LFEEVQARTRELTESLDQQTATGEILASISASMTDPQPVFDAIVRNVNRLFGTQFASVQLLHDGIVHMPASGGESGVDKVCYYPRPLDHTTVGGQAMLAKQVVQYSPVLGEGSAAPSVTQAGGREFGFNSVLYAPMVHKGKVVGAIGAARREPKAFDDKHVALIKAFADQAVIAIENTRLFAAEQESKRELQESLEYQTANAEVLGVISRSPGQLGPVFLAMLENAVRICEAKFGVLFSYDDGAFEPAAWVGVPPNYEQFLRQRSIFKPNVGTPLDRLLRTKDLVHSADEVAENSASPAVKHGSARSLVAVPMFKEDQLVSAIVANAYLRTIPSSRQLTY
jgi:GAF domain